jgi:pSer/pThr/pTyr-binding forkhead associated (FHA) protein
MKLKVSIIVLLFTLFGLAMSCAQATEYPIDYILLRGKTLQSSVTTHGMVSNSTAAAASPTSNIKGEYDLTDPQTSASIHVLTTSDPPPNGIERKVTATIDASGDKPRLIESGIEIPWYLFAALGGLLLIAIVLIIVLVKKPSGSSSPSAAGPQLNASPISPARPLPSGPTIQQSVISSPPPAPPVRASAVLAEKICAKCRKVNTPDAQWCEECGEPLQVANTALPRTPPPTSMEVVSRRNAETKAIIDDAPEETPVADLTIIEGEGAQNGTTFSLRKREQTIGRSDNVTITLADDTVSRKHASIIWEDGAFYLKDDGSTSGTFVNGQKVTQIQAHRLTHGDRIQLGKTKLMFRTIQSAPEAPGH